MNLAALVAAGLVAARISGLVISLPAFSSRGIPKMVKLMIVVSLTAVISPVVPHTMTNPTIPVLLIGMLSELMMGVIIGSTVSMVFGGLGLAMEIMATQTGQAVALQFNPFLQFSQQPLGTMAGLFATLIFLAMDQHLIVLHILATSFHDAPPGSTLHIFDAFPAFIPLASAVIQAGVSLAGPFLAMVLTINSFVAVLSRLAPSMNVFFSVGFLLTAMMGVALFFISMPQIYTFHDAQVTGAIDLLPELIELISGD